MIERRLEQAAEVVEPRQEQAAEEREAGVKEWQILADAHVRLSFLLSFPHSGNDLSQPLDSSFRWNDGGGDRPKPSSLYVHCHFHNLLIPVCVHRQAPESTHVVMPAKAGMTAGIAFGCGYRIPARDGPA